MGQTKSEDNTDIGIGAKRGTRMRAPTGTRNSRYWLGLVLPVLILFFVTLHISAKQDRKIKLLYDCRVNTDMQV